MHPFPVVRTSPKDPDINPFMVFWELTRACDLACLHCRAEAIPERNPGELKLPVIERVLDDLIPARPLLILTGGDCFKRPDLECITAAAAERHIPVAISPSTTPLVTRVRLDALRAAGATAASISLDGSSPQIFEAFRGVAGTYNRAMRIWDDLHAAGFKVQVNTTVTRLNLDDLPHIAKLCQAKKVMTWSVFFLVRTGRGQALPAITATEAEDVLNWLYDIGYWIPVKTTEGHHFKRIVMMRQGEHRNLKVPAPGPLYDRLTAKWHALNPGPPQTHFIRPPLHLNVGRGMLFIDHLGNVYPGGFLPLSAGNVKTENVLDIYRNHPLFKRLRRPATWPGYCGQCPFSDVCGGSRARAYADRGSPFAADPLCILVEREVQHGPMAPPRAVNPPMF